MLHRDDKAPKASVSVSLSLLPCPARGCEQSMYRMTDCAGNRMLQFCPNLHKIPFADEKEAALEEIGKVRESYSFRDFEDVLC